MIDTRPQTEPCQGVFFLHIAKTAGSSFADIFCFRFERFLRDAHHPGSGWREVLDGDKTFFISGHFSLENAADVVERPDLFSFTVLREPMEQVASHFRWVKAYGNPDRADKLGELSPAIADLARNMWNVPLDDVDAMKNVVDCPGGRIFRNPQTRILSRGIDLHSTETAVDRVCAHLIGFDFFFTLEDADRAYEILNEKFGPLEPLKNTNRSMLEETVNLEDESVLNFYRQFVELDLNLYETVKRESRKLFDL